MQSVPRCPDHRARRPARSGLRRKARFPVSGCAGPGCGAGGGNAGAEDKEKDQHLVGERLAVEKVFKNYPKLTETKVGGIYIDNNLEAFTFGELLNPDTVVVHVEKANPEIRGLYAAINKLFLENEFPDVEFVNREEDLGLEGLRQAKLSYKPIKLVEKYTLIEK